MRLPISAVCVIAENFGMIEDVYYSNVDNSLVVQFTDKYVEFDSELFSAERAVWERQVTSELERLFAD